MQVPNQDFGVSAFNTPAFIFRIWSNVCSSFVGVSVATCMAILQVGTGLQLRTASTGSKEEEIGRASSRDSVSKSVSTWVVAVSLSHNT